MGNNVVKRFAGQECPNKEFTKRLLEEDVHVDEGKPLVKLLKEEAEIEHYEDIYWIFEEEDE